jgi:hypothetical protein
MLYAKQKTKNIYVQTLNLNIIFTLQMKYKLSYKVYIIICFILIFKSHSCFQELFSRKLAS